MGKPSVNQAVIEIIEPVIQGQNLELVDVEYKKAGKNWILRVFIDKEQGITVDDCQRVSREIEDVIEVNDLIAAEYTLEVSSPGLDRPLKKEKDFLRAKNKKIRVHTFSPVNEKRDFEGIVSDCTEAVLYLEIRGEALAIPLETIAKAKLVIEY